MDSIPNSTTAPSSTCQVGAILRRYKKKATAQVIVGAICWIGIALCVLTLSWLFALGWWGGNDVRISGFLIWFTSLVVTLVLTLLLPLKKLQQPTAISKKIGGAFPQYRSAIISADQFATNPSPSEFSVPMLNQHLQDVQIVLLKISPNDVLPKKRLLLPTILLGATIGLGYFFASIHQPILSAGLNSLFFDRDLPEQKVFHERLKPVVSDLGVRLKYPKYLGKKEKLFTSFSGGIEAPLGTTVIVEATPIEAGTTEGAIHLSNGETKKLNFLSDGRVVGKFLIDDVEWFSLSVGNERNLIGGPKRAVHVEMDRRPTIRLLRPTQAVEVDADGDVFVEFEAHDDHGIGKIDLIIRNDRDVNIQRTITHCAPNVTHIRTNHRWTVGNIRLEDIHEVELLVRVYDDDTILGPKFSNSAPVKIKIMTPKSRQRELIVKQGQILDGLVDLLSSRLSTSIPSTSERADEIRPRFLKLRGETEDSMGAIGKLLTRLDSEPTASSMLKETYRQIREDVTNQLLYEAKLNNAPLAPFKSRAGVDSVTVRILEKAIAQVDDLILDMQFYAMDKSGKLLEQQRKSLSELLKLYQRHPSERARRNILEAIKRMERTASALAEKMDTIRGQISSAPVSSSLDEAIDLNDYFKNIRKLLGKGDIGAAVSLCEKMEQSVGQLMANLEGGHLAFKNERFGKHNEFVEQLLDKLASAEGTQLQLRRKTIGVQRQYKEKILNMMRDEIDELVKTQSRKVKKIRSSIENIKDRSSSMSSKLISQLRDLTKRMDDVLRQGDLDRTMEIAKEIKSRVRLAAGSKISRKTYSELKSIEKLSANIVNKITSSFPNPNRVFNDQDKRVIRTVTFNQRRVYGNTKKISSWVRDQKSKLQFLSSQTLNALESVTRSMKESAGSLEKRELQDAAKSQTIALDTLSKLRQSLKNTGTAMVESTSATLPQQVYIPGPKEYQVPKKHREDILEAMRSQLPEGYKEAIKKYYETLVR